MITVNRFAAEAMIAAGAPGMSLDARSIFISEMAKQAKLIQCCSRKPILFLAGVVMTYGLMTGFALVELLI